MKSRIRWLEHEEDHPVDLVGGKGANLGRLLRLGMPVPRGFVVTTEAYHAFMTANGLTDADPDTLRDRILAAPIPATIGEAILDAYRQLGAVDVAVRSSGTAEDLAAASFAGQHDTFLNVAGSEAVLAAVRGCWASLWSLRAVAYRRRRSWDDRDLALAVVVQAMVPAEWAGVLFTADPITGGRDRLIVEAVQGLGEALVSGQVSGTRCLVEKAGRRILTEDTLLPPQVLDELTRLGVQIEEAFGQPQDVEWAWADGRCSVLQARPLTALPDEARQTGTREPRRYTRLQRANAPNMLDHFPLPPYPFDFSLFFRPGMERVFQAVSALGFSPPAVEEVFVEVADGVVQVIPPAFRPTPRALTLPAKLLASLRADPNVWLEECRTTLVALAQQIDGEELATLSDRDLLDRIVALRRLEGELFVPRFGYFPRGMLISQGLALLLRLAVGREAPRIQTDLLAAVPCTTTAANQELGRLARLIRASAELRRVFLEEIPDRLPARLSESDVGRPVLAEVQTFLQRFGYRETAMPAAALPAWRDDPSVVFGLLKGLVGGEQAASALDPSDGERAERAKRELIAALSRDRFGLRRRLLLPLALRLLEATRAFIAFREDSHFYLFMPFAVIRRLALELGRRLMARGLLSAAEDIFFLEIDELKEPGPAAAVWEKVDQRRRARRQAEGRYTTVPAELLEQTTRSDGVGGVPVGPGQAVGQVRIILNERDFWKLQPGEVLVARYTNPTWTPLFAVAGAVVVDAGGASSHAAIVAREYGIPAVMGTGNATGRLRDGQKVLVDGTSGRVVPLGE